MTFTTASCPQERGPGNAAGGAEEENKTEKAKGQTFNPPSGTQPPLWDRTPPTKLKKTPSQNLRTDSRPYPQIITVRLDMGPCEARFVTLFKKYIKKTKKAQKRDDVAQHSHIIKRVLWDALGNGHPPKTELKNIAPPRRTFEHVQTRSNPLAGRRSGANSSRPSAGWPLFSECSGLGLP